MTLSRGAIELLKVLRSFGTRIFPLQSTLAKRLGCTVRTVRRWLKELTDAGKVMIQKRGRTSACYQIIYQQVADENVRSEFPQECAENIGNEDENLWSEVQNVRSNAHRSLLLNLEVHSERFVVAPATVFVFPETPRKPPDRERALVQAVGASP